MLSGYFNIYKNYKNWKLKRHVAKFGSKNNGYFNYFNKEWFEEHQETLIWLLNHWLLKYWFRWILRIHKDCKFGEVIDEIRPNTYRIKISENTFRSDFRTHQKFSKRIYYAFCPVWWFAHFFDWVLLDRQELIPSFGFLTLSAYPDASPGASTVDGISGCYGKDLTFSNIKITTGNASTYYDTDTACWYIGANSTTNHYSNLTRGIFLFNTSSLTSNATISDAIITFTFLVLSSDYLVANAKAAIVSSNPASNTTLSNSDFETCGTTEFANATPTSAGAKDFVLNSSGINNISKTAISKFACIGYAEISSSITWETDRAAYATIYYADNAGVISDPKLVVTYTYSAPTVTTQAVSSIADTTATGNGNVTSDGGATVTERGVCWKTSTGPTTADSKATSAGTTGAYTASMTGLTASTLYYVKAYAINSIGTSYGSEVTFTSSAPVTAIKAIFGIPIADIKTINGIPGASIKSIMGLTYVQPAPIVPWYGERGINGGGWNKINIIEYVTITTTGNAADFGDLTVGKYFAAGSSSGTRGIFAGGVAASDSNVIEYITIATTGNATDFGDLTANTEQNSGITNVSKGFFAFGYAGGTSNIIEYVTFSTLGNSTDFGDQTVACYNRGGCNDATRGILGSGLSNNTIDYITMSTTGNATDFGDATISQRFRGSCSSTVRGIWNGGSSASNVIDYVTIQTTGNAIDFGDLTIARDSTGTSSNGTRGIFCAGESTNTNTIDYVTIATTGNATDFGDMLTIAVDTVGFSGN